MHKEIVWFALSSQTDCRLSCQIALLVEKSVDADRSSFSASGNHLAKVYPNIERLANLNILSVSLSPSLAVGGVRRLIIASPTPSGLPMSPQPVSITPPEESPEEKAPETPKASTPRNVVGPGMGRGSPVVRTGSGPLTAPLSPIQTSVPSTKEPDTLASLAGRRVGPGIVNPPPTVPTSPNRLADLGPPSNGLARSLSGQGGGSLGGLGLKTALAGQGLEVPALGAQSPVGSRLGAFTQAPPPSGNKIADAAEAVTGGGLGGRIFNPGEGSQWRPQAGFQGQSEVSDSSAQIVVAAMIHNLKRRRVLESLLVFPTRC